MIHNFRRFILHFYKIYSIALFDNKSGRLKLFFISNLFAAFLELIGLAFIAGFITQYLGDSSSIKIFFLYFESKNTALAVVILFWVFRSAILSLLYIYNNDFIQLFKSGIQLYQLQNSFNYKGRHIEKEAGKLFNSLTTEVQIITGQFLMPVFASVPELLLIVLFFAYALWVAPISIITALTLIISGALLVQKLISPFSKKYGKLRLSLEKQWSESIINYYNSKQELDVYNVTSKTIDFLHSSIKEANYNSGRFLSLKPINKSFLELFGVLAVLVILIMSPSGDSDSKEQTLFIVLTMLRTLPSFNRILTAIQSYKFSTPVITKQLQQIMEYKTADECKNILLINRNQIKCHTKPNVTPSFVQFDLSYPSLTVICGASGVGKTVLLNSIVEELISNYKPQDDAICFSYASQNNLIINGNVCDNINFMRSPQHERTDKARHYLTEWGFSDVHFDENISCINFSGGQKRRICVARALSDKANLVLMDEPTSGLDLSSLSAVIKSIKLESSKRVIIVISHDQLLIDQADRVIRLEPALSSS